ncbi:hypothetical protein HLB42_21495 (plasmid) [Deinococcus sp. D7000]|nr:hypothetical protein HLB42_13770 [Deinococcus sp. D7000]QLG13516.1 hypothetical protein HLB42_21495 [Deinococcus sp. D7000]
MRLTLSRPGAALPYAVLHRPQTAVPDSVAALLGGDYEVERGQFSGRGSFSLNRPPAFQHGDWLRLYWERPGDTPDTLPDYAGEVIGEPWREGGGIMETRGLMEKLRACRWIGTASGDFPTFFGDVLDRTVLPAGFSVPPLPDVPGSAFSADVAFELLGDTIQAITPALGGRLIGVDNAGQVVCVDPETGLQRRFPWGAADMPAGSTDNYANCVRFSFEYPSSDKGWFEGRNEPEITRAGGEVWHVTQTTARELGYASQPYAAATGSITRTFSIPGQLLPPVDVTQSGVLSALLANEAAARPEIVYAPNRALNTLPIDVVGLYGLGAASSPLLYLTGIRDAAVQTVQFYPDAPLQRSEAVEIVDNRGRIELIVQGTIEPSLPPWQTFNAVWKNSAGDVLDYYGGMDAPRLPGWDAWTPVDDSTGYLLTVPIDVAEGLSGLRYKSSYISNRKDAGVKVGVIEVLPGGRFRADLDTGDAPGSSIRSFTLKLLPSGDYQPSVEVTVASRVDGVTGQSVQATLPFPITSGPVETILSPLTILRDQMTVTGHVRLEFDPLLTLGYGSSVELKPRPGGGSVAGAWVLPGGPSALAADQSYAAQAGVPLGLATEARARGNPYITFATLAAVDDTPDGWKRFAVRGPQSWDGTGPPPDLTGHTLLLLGVQNLMDLRIKTPQMGNLGVYAAELLRYRAEPVREWTGHVQGLERLSVTGQAAFEGLTGPDVVLDVQRVKINLNDNSMEVLCGSPLPSSDASAIAGTIKDVQRAVRRAGGA